MTFLPDGLANQPLQAVSEVCPGKPLPSVIILLEGKRGRNGSWKAGRNNI